MTENFRTDEATGSDAQFAADDQKYGNSQEGDGSRFRRRGFFGLRGRTMYDRLQRLMPQYQSLTNPESVALTQNSIMIAVKLWTNPDLLSRK
jgi:predicted chitinase